MPVTGKIIDDPFATPIPSISEKISLLLNFKIEFLE